VTPAEVVPPSTSLVDRTDAIRAAVDSAVVRALGEYADRSTVTVEEFGEIVGLGRSSAYELCRSGRVRGIRCGRAIRVGIPEVVALLIGAERDNAPAHIGGVSSEIPAGQSVHDVDPRG
jgi:hypothetical protein